MDNFIQIIKEKMNHFSFHSNYTPSSKKWSYIIPLLIVLILSIVGEYVLLLPIHFQSQTFIFHLIFLLVLFAMLHAILLGTIDQVSKVFVAISLGLLIYVGIGSVYSAPIFHAKNYQKQLLLDKKADFYKDNETISYQSIPVVDRESAIKLGDRKMGQMIDYVSQFEVDESYEQINYQETPYRVTPLEYSDLIKWVTNRKEGLPAYIKVNMVTQESEVVELKEGMKYSKSEHFGRNIYRHLRMNYPTKMFEELAFEIDEKGTLYWIAPVFEYQIGPFGGKDIVGALPAAGLFNDIGY